MIWVFIIVLFGTFLIVRFLAHTCHDMKTYNKNNPKESKAKTITGWLRKKTDFDWHHIHFGFIILFASIISLLIYGFNNINVVFLAIGLSMVADQITPLIDDKSNYFSKEKLLLSALLHVIIALIAILMIFYIC